jgi:hypothetical protein
VKEPRRVRELATNDNDESARKEKTAGLGASAAALGRASDDVFS